METTSEMLAKALANGGNKREGAVEFRHGLIEALLVDSDSIDVTISNCVIDLTSDKTPVLREMIRVYRSPDSVLGKPGERVHVSGIVAPGRRTVQQFTDHIDVWGVCIAGALSVDEFQSGLQAAGFVPVLLHPTDATPFSEIPRQHPFSALTAGRKPA